MRNFCVGYFNLRGWGGLAPYVDDWSNDNGPCRVLIGMQRLPHEELRAAFTLLDRPSGVDNQTAHRLRVQLAEQLRQQLTIGVPTNADEKTLRQLAGQLRLKEGRRQALSTSPPAREALPFCSETIPSTPSSAT